MSCGSFLLGKAAAWGRKAVWFSVVPYRQEVSLIPLLLSADPMPLHVSVCSLESSSLNLDVSPVFLVGAVLITALASSAILEPFLFGGLSFPSSLSGQLKWCVPERTCL